MQFKLEILLFLLLPQLYFAKQLAPRAMKFGISATVEKQQIQSRIAAASITEEEITTRLPTTARQKELYFAELASKSDKLLEWFSIELKEGW